MAVIRQQNWLSQQRIDIPHLRSVESGVAGDFDLLAGRIIAGQKPLIINGFNITVNTSIINNPVTNLVLNVAGAQIIHFLASESGSIFYVPASRSPETLNSTNSRVSGSFTPSTTNYVGIDLVRSTDSTTNDLVQFVDPDTGLETSKTVPLARTLDYKIIIQTSPFASSSNIAPVAIVVTDTNNSVTSVEDARKLMFRLGSGGDSPNASNTFSWSSRKENAISTTTGSSDPFSGGDKQLASFKDWIDAINTRIWELGGGEYWYGVASDKNVRLAFTTPTGGMQDNVEFNGTQIRWSGLTFVFADSTAVTNTVTDNTSYQTFNDKQCLYVDVNRSTDGAVLTASIINLASLNSTPPTIPGSRYIIAWRSGSNVYVRNKEYWTGKSFAVATTSTAGAVFLSYAAGNASTPTVAPLDANGSISNTASGGNAAAFIGTGNGSGSGISGTGGGSSSTVTAGKGLFGQGGQGHTAGNGIVGTGGATADNTTAGYTAGHGVVGTGGTVNISTQTAGDGVRGTGGNGQTNAGGAGSGGNFTGGIAHNGGIGVTSLGGDSYDGLGTGGSGVKGTGGSGNIGATGGYGVEAHGGSAGGGSGTDGNGLYAIGGGTSGAAIQLDQGNGGSAIRVNGRSTAPSNPSGGDLWYDTSINTWRVYFDDLGEWSHTIHVVGGTSQPAYGTGWSAPYSTTTNPQADLHYYIDINRICHLGGMGFLAIGTAGTDTAVFTLPTGFRPVGTAGTRNFATVYTLGGSTTPTFTGIQIDPTTGNVTFPPGANGSSATSAYFDGIHFKTK